MPIDRKAMGAAIAKDVEKLLIEKPSASGASVAGAALAAGLKFLADRIDELEARAAELQSRLDKQAQQQSALAKQLAALERKPQQ